jgi:hypothetical protein
MAIKYHFDQLAALDRQGGLAGETAGRTDATGYNAFFSNQLEMIRAQLYAKKYPELKARRLVPVKNDIPLGVTTYTERGVDEVGEAEFLSDVADDSPEVEIVKDGEDSYYMRKIGLKYGWDLQEAWSAMHAGTNLQDKKANACRRGIERFIDKNLLIGGVTGGRTLYGLFTLAGSFAPLTFAGDLVGAFKDQSNEDLYRNLSEFVLQIYTNSKEIEMPDTLVMPTTLKAILSMRPMGDANTKSILQFFLESNDFIKNIETTHYLEASGGHGGGSAARFVAYKRDAEVIEGLVNEFMQLPPEYKSMRVSTQCLARVGGVAARRPKGISYWDVAI